MSLEPVALWFQEKARKLPWRLPRHEIESDQRPDPWAVLVSEIMLQQTQVATALPYFEKWMKRFPSPESLAIADESEVMKLWEGLGYYRRARGLQKAAQFLVEKGAWPQTREGLLEIPSVGPYTSAALLAFAFHQKSLPVDGNVLRVASRWLSREEDISKPSTAKLFEKELFQHLPNIKPWIVAEGLIELGATVCLPKEPKCHLCPLQVSCLSYKEGKERTLPIKKAAASTESLYRVVAVVATKNQDSIHWLACQKQAEGVFQGLWHFPYIEKEDSFFSENSHQRIENLLGIPLEFLRPLKNRKHSFTRYRAYLEPLYFKSASSSVPIQEGWHYEWLDINRLKNLTFCSGHRHIRDELIDNAL